MTTTTLTYRDRLALLRKAKLKQTQEKIARHGYMDHDDHGTIAPPEDFHWEPKPNHPSGGFFGPKGVGENFRSLMEAHPVYVDPNDALAGRMMVYLGRFKKVGWRPEFDCSDLHADQRRYGLVSGIGAGQHFGPDLAMGLELGFGGLLKKIRHYRAEHGPEKAEFYQGLEDVVLGIQNWIGRTIVAIREAEQKETCPDLQQNLREMAEANEWLIENPPRTLREACQWLAWYMQASRIFNGDGAGGRLDELLRPYYEADVAAGRTDDEAAIFYVACLLLADTHYHQISGPGADGRDLTSRMSYLILEAAHRIGSSCNLTVRVHEGMDRKFFRTAVRHLVEDRKAWPRFFRG